MLGSRSAGLRWPVILTSLRDGLSMSCKVIAGRFERQLGGLAVVETAEGFNGRHSRSTVLQVRTERT